MRYKGNTGEFPINSLAAVFYDKNNVRLGVGNFPEQNILPGEAVKSQLFSYGRIEDVARVKIGVRGG